jgi:hypothetical protein
MVDIEDETLVDVASTLKTMAVSKLVKVIVILFVGTAS